MAKVHTDQEFTSVYIQIKASFACCFTSFQDSQEPQKSFDTIRGLRSILEEDHSITVIIILLRCPWGMWELRIKVHCCCLQLFLCFIPVMLIASSTTLTPEWESE